MFRPGNIGHVGRLGLVAGSQPTLVTQALTILAKYGSAANLFIPGVGAISGITTGNWADSAGMVAATVDNQVGLVESVIKNYAADSKNTGAVFTIGTATSATYNTSTGAGVAYRVDVSNQSGIRFPFTTNTQTQISITVSSGTLFIRSGSIDQAVIATLTTGTYTLIAVSGGSGFISIAASSSSAAFTVNSIRQTSSLITQSVSGNRPVLRLTGGFYSWQFDGSNDNFATGIATPSEGYYVGGALCTNTGTAHTIGGGSGGAGDADAGLWVARQSNGNIRISVGNGTTRNSLLSQNSPINSVFVASAGWSLSSIFTGVNNVEVSAPNAINCATSRQILIGATVTGASTPYLPMIGNLYAQLWIVGTTPSASERETLRRFIASLSGVTL